MLGASVPVKRSESIADLSSRPGKVRAQVCNIDRPISLCEAGTLVETDLGVRHIVESGRGRGSDEGQRDQNCCNCEIHCEEGWTAVVGGQACEPPK